MDEMIARWIRETRIEYERTKSNQNIFKMIQMNKLEIELKMLRERLGQYILKITSKSNNLKFPCNYTERNMRG